MSRNSNLVAIDNPVLRRERQAIRAACEELEALYRTVSERSGLRRDDVKELVRELIAGELEKRDGDLRPVVKERIR